MHRSGDSADLTPVLVKCLLSFAFWGRNDERFMAWL
jgi:hypothetical protein